jgi:peroxiredoxin
MKWGRSKRHDPDLGTRPPGPPPPVDDGDCRHLPGQHMPGLALRGTDGRFHAVDRAPTGYTRLILYACPRTGRPGEKPLTPDWDLIPGARGCTPESCGFRDHAAELALVGAAVAGLSTQSSAYQQEAAQRLGLPFPLLSDADLSLTRSVRLPTFDVAGHTLLKRFTMIIRSGVIEHVFYPVFPPDRHAEEVVAWVRDQEVRG